MDFLKLAKSRHSIRRYTQKSVSQEDVIKLLKAAQSAPSGGNCQPWHFFVIRDKNLQANIVDATSGYQSFILSAPVMIVVCADIPRSETRYGARGKTLFCIQDTAAAIQNMLLCAKSLGLGTCWCGAFDEAAVSNSLNLTKELRPVAIIPIGYPAGKPLIPTARRPLNKIVTFIGAGDEADNLSDGEPHRKVEHGDMGGTAFEDVNPNSTHIQSKF